MIKELEGKNFKSLKNLKLDCKRVNLFIGKPNTGKSNILESVGIFSFPYGNLSDFVGFENMINLFYDENLEEKIGIANDIYYSVCLETEGHKVIAVSNFQDVLAEASRGSFEFAFVDLRLGMEDGIDLIPPLLAAALWLKIIVITAYASIDTAVEAMRRGATDYIPKPFTPAQVKLAVDKVFEMRTLEQRVA